MEHDWIIAPPWPERDALAVELGVAPVIAQVLHNRGIDTAETGRHFLGANLNGLAEPDDYEDLSTAATLVGQAIRENRKIIIYSDYDVDGVCGAAVLWHVIRRAGADLDVYIPHRIEEGYGLNAEAIDKLAADGVDLMITVDSGIRDHEVVRHAREHGMAVIITDHHEPGPDFPPASAVVHPARPRAGVAPPAVNPCGAAVAFKLAWAVAREISGGKRVGDDFREDLVELTALVALAMVADVVPLLAENRVLTRFGLGRIPGTRLVGLRALLESVKLSNVRIESYHLAFVLGPRLNAAGRMGHAKEAFDLLTTDDPDRARELAGYLDKQNKARQKLEERITREAAALAEAEGQLAGDRSILVLAQEGWHVGIIGIVASKLVERFAVPVVLIAFDGRRGQGSARSVEGYDMNEALDACGAHLLGYGGHAMAAGLQIEPGKIDEFRAALAGHAAKGLADRRVGSPLKIDAELQPPSLTRQLIGELQQLGPFGRGNPRPVFCTSDAELIGYPKTVGQGGKHLAFNVRWGRRMFRAIAFNQAHACERLLDARRCRLAFEPTVDTYLGTHAIQLRVKDIKTF